MQDIDARLWRKTTSAPKDGTRILVLIKASEQGEPDVDVVRWMKSKTLDENCWVSTDSTRDCAIVYGDCEVASWMPLPAWTSPHRTPAVFVHQTTEMFELDGSGI